MSDPFNAALDEVLVHEGGFSNNPADPGGMTNLGVTKAVWERYVGHPVSESEMRSLTREEVAPLYQHDYWLACGCDKLPGGLALCVFDFAVNAGQGRAVRFVQRLCGAVQDGQCGPHTIQSALAFCALRSVPTAIQRYQDMRRDYYRSLSTFPVFGKGWLRRCDEVQAAAEKLA